MKVALFQSYLFGFRVPILNKLNKKIDLTVFFDEYKKIVDNEIEFKTKKCVLKSIFGFWWQKLDNFNVNEYDVIVLMLDAKLLSNFIVLILSKINRKKVICWGIGLGRSNTANKIRLLLVNLSDGLIVYSDNSKEDFVNLGVLPRKIHVANNTIDFGVNNADINFFKLDTQIRLLFVGALEERKGLLELIDDFANFAPKDSILNIVGDGPLKNDIASVINYKGMEERIIMHGNITSKTQLAELYRVSDISVSLRQSGLSVLQAFAFGRPFVTYADSISGGEKNNIIDDNNGYLLGDGNKFVTMEGFLKSKISKGKLEELYNNSRNTYETSASPENMVEQLYEAIICS